MTYSTHSNAERKEERKGEREGVIEIKMRKDSEDSNLQRKTKDITSMKLARQTWSV